MTAANALALTLRPRFGRSGRLFRISENYRTANSRILTIRRGVMFMIYVTLPAIRGVKTYDPSRTYASFWWMTISMVFMVFVLTGAGMVQVYMERLMGLDYEAVKANYNLWFWIFRAIIGAGFVIGVAIFAYDFFKLGKEPAPTLAPAIEKA